MSELIPPVQALIPLVCAAGVVPIIVVVMSLAVMKTFNQIMNGLRYS